ncbi:rhodanese-like domain-containing protein [Seonamhaeicola marinus]|uniref:Rhodanese-like domain-containing protein n=1 Tax=Seonamhaeicola marinus TaxID=1912246 RepID=A0A5D0HVH3_9FLAO|nr:rhodanese-like domain-containing protein [Seonamhaeicola marinus]TYA74830.1 rhodanese-like domain-containing protein [Seonamhaeicola marinus]
MKKLTLLTLFLFTAFGFSQKKLNKLLKAHNSESIPYIYVNDLKSYPTNTILLDAREKREYATSHLKNAICVGYDFFNLDSTTTKIPSKDSKIVVYCSLGIRSEDIAEKLKKAGYKNVYNLYGGIFEWKNNDNPVYNSEEKETENVHTFSKDWSKWLKKGTKVYE